MARQEGKTTLLQLMTCSIHNSSSQRDHALDIILSRESTGLAIVAASKTSMIAGDCSLLQGDTLIYLKIHKYLNNESFLTISERKDSL